MDAVVTHDPNIGTDQQFVTEADWIPKFWNDLLDFDRDDLIAELVQNDLDQDATRTVISFEEDRLVCEGNGKPVEADGWQRLRIIQGAGHKVPAKRGKIGVKNHGLKTAFTVGYELQLMSARHAIVQTLYANGRNKPPYPGASAKPIADPQAPADGCRITIWYRNADIEPRQGEATVLGAIGMQEIDDLFLSACASVPEQFAGIVSPEVVPRYEIVLRHWSLGEARFRFSCTRPRKIAKRIELFRRRCTVNGTVSSLPEGLQEQAARRLVPLEGRLRQRVADFFRRGRYFFVEVSWPIDQRGRPGIGIGRFRYPIGYPQASHEARTGHSAYFNVPVASDNKRHGPARNEATNAELRAACERLLIDVLARHTVPRWGAEGLHPLISSSDVDNHDMAIRPLLSVLANQGAMPVLNWRTAAELVFKGKKRNVRAAARRLAVQGRSKETKRYRFVVPATTWAPDRIHPALSLLCPRSEMQLDPRTHPDIVRLLTDGKTSGFTEGFVTFDEDAALSRVTSNGNEYFGAVADPEREFSEPLIARSYLDLIRLALDRDKCDEDREDALIEALLIPDICAQATPLQDLYSSAPLPSDVPSLRLPPVLHADLVAHPLFKRKKWRRPKYTMARFLDGGTLRASDEDTRRLFWQWLRRNERRVAPRERPKLADHAIWPDENGSLGRISDLCDPRSSRVGAVLADFIRRPHDHVRHSKLVSAGRKARTSIRHVPTKDEITHWLDTRMAGFKVGEKPGAATIENLKRFESDLAILLKDTAITRRLKEAEVTLPALAQDGSVQPRMALVLPGHGNDRVALSSRFLLRDRQWAAALDKLSQALSAPTAAMLLDTFVADSGNFSVLHPRLQQFLNVTEPGDDERLQLADMPILPAHGKPRTPSTLAFIGNRGDYWGDWKSRIPAAELSQDDQRRYRAVGVTSALPNPKTSRAFFHWLSTQDRTVLCRHIPHVLRHILHRDGPSDWAETFTETPFIPVKGRDGLRLVSLRTARRSPVYLPDAGDVGDVVIQKDGHVLLVVDRVKEVTEPISESLRKLGVRSLREALEEPENVAGAGEIGPADENILVRFSALQSSPFRRTFLKRLGALGIESELVRHDWQHRLGRVKDIRFADEVKARYRFRRKPYQLEVDAGFDPESGIFWMKRNHGTGLSSLYESVAKYLVFKPIARPIDLLALERTVELEINDPSFGRPAGVRLSPNDNNITAKDAGRDEHGEDEEDGAEIDPGEAVFGHSPFEPDAMRNTPKPGPIPSRSRRTSRRPTHRNGASRSSKDDSHATPTPKLEEEHIETLKLSHYASHCQMCLCERPPRVLAPKGSYIQWEEVRRRVVEAHHVDLKAAGGARHAGNLILLCKLHHDNYGRRLTRSAITVAFGANTKEKSIRFGVDSEVKGQQIELAISDTGEVVKLFFTDEHAAFWVSHGQARD